MNIELEVTALPPPTGHLTTWLFVRNIYTAFIRNINYSKESSPNIQLRNQTASWPMSSKSELWIWDSLTYSMKSSQKKSPDCTELGQSGLHDSLRLCFSCNLLGTLQQSVVDVFSAGNLRLDHAEVLRIRHGLCLDCVWLGCCWDQVGWMFGAVNALGEALVCQSLHREDKCEFVLYIQYMWFDQ